MLGDGYAPLAIVEPAGYSACGLGVPRSSLGHRVVCPVGVLGVLGNRAYDGVDGARWQNRADWVWLDVGVAVAVVSYRWLLRLSLPSTSCVAREWFWSVPGGGCW